MRGRLHLCRPALGLAVFLAAAPLVRAGEADAESPEFDPQAIIAQLEQRIGQQPDLLTDVDVDLDRLRAAITSLEESVQKARLESARAYARMASYTATILSRELKKVSTSARVLAMTRQTERTEEVERYEGRHNSLLENIDHIAAQYADLVARLGAMEAAAARIGLEEYEQFLISEGLADQIKVHRIVIQHIEQYDKAASANVEQWKSDFQSL